MHHARNALASVLAGAALGATGVALAAWTSPGTGSATAQAATAQPLTVDVSATTAPTNTLFPGATGTTAGDLVVRVTNPNPYPVVVTSVTQDTAAGKFVTSSAGAACTDAPGTANPTGVTLAASSGLSSAVPAGTTSTLTLSRVVSMATTSANGCQGAQLTIPVTVVGQSAP